MSQFREDYHRAPPQHPQDHVSLTRPDMHIPIRTLLAQHSRGTLDNTLHREGEYFETEIPVIDDLTDLQAYRDSLEERKKAVEAQMKADIELKRKKDDSIQRSQKSPVKTAENDSLENDTKEQIVPGKKPSVQSAPKTGNGE